ncbi:MAG: hypothetical protein A2589_00430 [Candidatus Vogelbacteria bacterium RIFOXYD1_FULL_46_19]|uniref:Uncharacterized protein n=1 Tax=Candidatus Vogelbacteria bacterium RIFOXYD1_FULL_46_19 TaxID=1802439 RepID=A0A1G2QJG8_9BACT|nr:MAG: hypothetical protein A2589_00430 [Candidatus Vogelbacteria bacterium RIFOXYD1_FULL_46_19]
MRISFLKKIIISTLVICTLLSPLLINAQTPISQEEFVRIIEEDIANLQNQYDELAASQADWGTTRWSDFFTNWLGIDGDRDAEDNILAIGEIGREIQRLTIQRDNALAQIAEDNNNTQEAERLREQIALREERLQDSTTSSNTYSERVQNIRDQQVYNCNLISTNPNWDGCLAGILDGISSILLWLYTWVISLADTLFAYIVKTTITDFRDYVTDLSVIDIGWTVARDLSNIFFIFILLYLAIGTILQLPNVNTKKTLVNVIVIALLVNFSGFITKVAIDASNIVAMTFYQQIGDDPNKDPSIAQPFRDQLSFFEGIKSPNDYNSGYFKLTAGVLVKNIGILILQTITIFTLLAASLLFLIRGVSLLFLIMTSPLAFLGYTFTPLKEVFNLWSTRLRCDLLFAPLFMFFLYVTLGIMKNLNTAASNSITTSGPTGQIFTFLTLNGLMLGSMLIAQKVGCQLGSSFSNKAIGLSKWAARGATVGAVGVAGRNTIGILAKKAQNSDGMKKLTAKTPKIGWAANKAMAGVAGYGFGTDRGYTQTVDRRQKRQEEIAGQLRNPKLKAEYLSNLNEEDRKKNYEKLSDREKADLEIKNVKDNPALAENMKALRNGIKDPERREKADEEFGKRLREELRQTVVKDAEGNVVKDKDGKPVTKEANNEEQLKNFAALSADYQKLAYEALSDTDKAIFETEANKGPNESLKQAISALRKGQAGDKDHKIKKAQKDLMEQAAKDDTATAIEAINNHATDLQSLDDQTATTIIEEMGKLTYKNRAAIKPEILANEKIVKEVTPKDLEQIEKSGNMSANNWRQLEKAIDSHGNSETKEYLATRATPKPAAPKTPEVVTPAGAGDYQKPDRFGPKTTYN